MTLAIALLLVGFEAGLVFSVVACIPPYASSLYTVLYTVWSFFASGHACAHSAGKLTAAAGGLGMVKLLVARA
jgi:hypothetical protein